MVNFSAIVIILFAKIISCEKIFLLWKYKNFLVSVRILLF